MTTTITPTAPRLTYTADEFFDWVAEHGEEDARYELVNGEIVMAGGTGGQHGEVDVRLIIRVGSFVETHGLGRMTGAETCYRLGQRDSKDVVRCPDFGFVQMARAPQPLSDRYVPFAPDLAVEIVSPNESAQDVKAKVDDYRAFGVALVWVIDPETRTVQVYTQAGLTRLTENDILTGDPLLPGFRLLVRDLFPA